MKRRPLIAINLLYTKVLTSVKKNVCRHPVRHLAIPEEGTGEDTMRDSGRSNPWLWAAPWRVSRHEDG